MKLGIAIDLGSSRDVAAQLDRATMLIQAAEAAGIDSVWLGESYHDRPAPFHLPAPLVTLAHLGAVTTLGLGTGVLLLRAHNPRQLAYEAALVDAVSRGRLTLGVGLGDRWVGTNLGMAPLEENFFDNGLSVLKRSWRGQRGAPESWPVMPAPHRPGGPKILIGGHGNRALDRAVNHGDGYFAATHYSDALLQLRAGQYWDRSTDARGEVCVTRVCVVRETRRKARRVLSDYFAPITSYYLAHRCWGLGPDGTADASTAAMLVGTPQDVAEQLARYESWGVRRVNLRAAPLGMPVAEAIQTVQLIGSELELSGRAAQHQ
jgi:alkanesulfonate monooxygenase SsuD/methylene tetrahydromethanopterin reductase-like flavin-dependent oxidoreductase (luciferase family)